MSIIAAMLMLTAPAVQQEDIDLPNCGVRVPITRRLLRAIPDDGFTGATGRNGTAFLIGDIGHGARGSVAFVRRGGQWNAYSIGSLLVTIAVRRSTKTGNVYVWNQIQRAGYGTSFEQTRLPASGGRPTCDKGLKFPAAYSGQGEAGDFTFLDFNLAPNGRGAFLANGNSEDGTWRYTTTNYGVTWSKPAKTNSLDPGPGAFEAVTGAPAPLIRSLRRVVG